MSFHATMERHREAGGEGAARAADGRRRGRDDGATHAAIATARGTTREYERSRSAWLGITRACVRIMPPWVGIKRGCIAERRIRSLADPEEYRTGAWTQGRPVVMRSRR